MPLFEYKCKCGFSYEELRSNNDDTTVSTCNKCGGEAQKQMSRFAPIVTGGSDVESIDMTVGREANKRWQDYHDRQDIRRKRGKDLGQIETPKADGKYAPVMALGKKQEKEKRTEFTTALQEHREERVKKGVPQFADMSGGSNLAV